MALKYAIVLDRHPEYGVKVLPIDLNPATVPKEKLAWSHVFSGPNERGRNYVPEIGQPVLIEDNHFVAGPSGSNFHPVVATLNPSINQQGGLPGNMNLMQAFQEFLSSTKNNLLVPPNVKEEGDPVVRKRQDRGDYNFGQTKGMPSHTSIAQTFGMVLPQVKNISTAIDQFNGVLNAGMLGSFPGSSLGNIVGMISSNPVFQQALGQLSPDVQQAFSAISTFSRTVQGGAGGYGYSLGSTVNEQSINENAVKLITEVKDVADLARVLQELQSNTMLHGCETLSNEIIYVNDAVTANANATVNVGNVIIANANTVNTNTSAIIITSCGKVETKDSSDVLDILNFIMSLLNSFQNIPSSQSGTGIGGSNEVYKKWAEAQRRLPPQIEQARQKLIRDVSTAGGKDSNFAIIQQIQNLAYILTK
jgi:hypothetical protein